MAWIQQNWGTVGVSLGIIISVVLVVRNLIHRHHRGETILHCGGDCSRCKESCKKD